MRVDSTVLSCLISKCGLHSAHSSAKAGKGEAESRHRVWGLEETNGKEEIGDDACPEEPHCPDALHTMK